MGKKIKLNFYVTQVLFGGKVEVGDFSRKGKIKR